MMPFPDAPLLAGIASLLDPLASTPWDWMMDRFGFTPRYRGPLFLLAGGMFIATLIIATVLAIHVVMPGNGNPYAIPFRPRGETRTVRDPLLLQASAAARAPTGGFTEGIEAGRSLRPETLDEVFDAAVARGLGEPRILLSTPDRKHVRFYVCGACDPEWSPGGASLRGGCEYTRGFLMGAFEGLLGEVVDARETACRRMGAAYCEFDVRYGLAVLEQRKAAAARRT